MSGYARDGAMTGRFAAGSAACLMLALATALAHAQSPVVPPGARGAGPDARSPAAGTLRIGIGADWARTTDAYTNGTLRQLGARFSLDTLGPGAIRSLTAADAAARTASGLPDFRASLGATAVQARRVFESTPLTIEYGVTSRVAIAATVPFVTSIVRVDAVANPLANQANMGINPAIAAPGLATANGALVGQIESAAAFMNGRLATCTANPAAAGCGPINANPAAVRSLIDESLLYATALGTLYGRGTSLGAPFVPLAGSAAQASVEARLAGFKAQYTSFGAMQIVTAAPVGAPAPLTSADFQSVLSDSSYGIMANPLASVVRRGIGNLEFGAHLTLVDAYDRAGRAGSSWRERLWWRSAVAGTFRLGASESADAADLFPATLGDAGAAAGARLVTDVGVGTRWSVTAAASYKLQAASDLRMRVPVAPGDPFPEAYRTFTVSHDPGDEVSIDLAPRWSPTEAVSVAGLYSYRRKGVDSFVGSLATLDTVGALPGIEASILNADSDTQEHRFGAALAYSSVAAFDRGAARWPIELSITHYQTTKGSGGFVPKISYDAVQLRWYWRLRQATRARARD